MKTFKDEYGNTIFKIKNKKEYIKYCDLHTRLDDAIWKTGHRPFLFENDNPIIIKAIKILEMIQYSLCYYNVEHLQYKSGHAYGERL